MIRFRKWLVGLLVLMLTVFSPPIVQGQEVYEGVGQGLNGEITLEITMDGDQLTSIEVIDHQESPSISDPAFDRTPQAIIDQQSLEVDTVAGATYTSLGIIEAVEDALNKAGLALVAVSQSADEEDLEAIEKQADVVIIGGGGAGLAAAISALQNDATVIVLEKMPVIGGSTIIAGGQYNAVDSKRQEQFEMNPALVSEIEALTTKEAQNETHQRLMDELAEQIQEYTESGASHVFDSPQLHALHTYEGGDYFGNIELIERFAYGAEESVPWLEDLGVAFQDEIAIVTGALWQRTHQFVEPLVTGPFKAYQAYIDEVGDRAEIMLDTKALELIEEDGRVIGVKAEQNGNEVIVYANNGVVISTGGFARNNDMVLEYDEHWGDLEGLDSTNSVSATGDGIIMGQEIGASLVGMEYIQLLPVGDPETGGMQGNISKNAANQIFVNNEGHRFVAEDARRDTLTQGLLDQPDQEMWIVHDAHEYPSLDVTNDFNEQIGDLVENGKVVTGDTIEELAENMGVDVANFVATVEDYNQVVAGEKTDDFGKSLLQDPIDQAPFYASFRVPTVHHTMGGLEITTNAEVLDTNGAIIPGLYAAGEVVGGIHGANRLGGNAVPDTVVFGRIAGESAANNR